VQREAGDEGTTAAMELARPAMAAAPARERGERERERAGSGEGDGEGVLVPLLIGSWAQGTAVEADHAARKLGHGGHVHGHASPFGQILEHVVGVGVGRVGAELGQIGADLDLGPKIKFEARKLLYIFYLKCTVIRVVD